MRLIILTLVLLLASLSTVACGQEIERPSSMSTPVAEIKLLGPLPMTNTVLDVPEGPFYFVIDVDSRETYEIVGAVAGPSMSSVIWLDDNNLLVKGEDGAYEVSLDGGVTSVPSTPLPSPTPRDCVCTSLSCSICADPFPSADGALTAINEIAESGGLRIDVGSPGGAARFRFESADMPVWSPAGHLLAFIGNVCRGFDLFLFNPDAPELTNLSEYLHGIWDFRWRPDGSAIAVDIIERVGETRTLGLIDVDDGFYKILAEVKGAGELRPVEWSPNGKYLLFYHYGGRGACEGLTIDVPTPQPTLLEVLDE